MHHFFMTQHQAPFRDSKFNRFCLASNIERRLEPVPHVDLVTIDRVFRHVVPSVALRFHLG
ncbi:hypothetical protein EMIT0158MI4_200128 [Burkholderia ambifaria]